METKITLQDEEKQLSNILSKNLQMGYFCQRNRHNETYLVYKNAMFAGRKLLTLYPWSANDDNLARAYYGYAQTVNNDYERIKYAKEAHKIFDDLMRADYFQWEKYEYERQSVEDYLNSIT